MRDVLLTHGKKLICLIKTFYQIRHFRGLYDAFLTWFTNFSHFQNVYYKFFVLLFITDNLFTGLLINLLAINGKKVTCFVC